MKRRLIRCVKKIFNSLGLKITRVRPEDEFANWSTPFSVVDLEESFLSIYREVKPYTMVGIERSYCLFQSVRYVLQHGIQGAFVECGVWRGGSVTLMLRTLQLFGASDRDVYLYDTFEGMPPPSEIDVKERVKKPASQLMASEERVAGVSNIWCYAPLDDVRNHVRSTGYPLERVHFLKGRVEDTIPGVVPERIAILRLDTDWYSSTFHELSHLYPRLVEGGVVIIDDYGHWRGARAATDEYFSQFTAPPFLHRLDSTGRVAIKTPLA